MKKTIHDKQNTKMLNEEHFYKQSNWFTESQVTCLESHIWQTMALEFLTTLQATPERRF